MLETELRAIIWFLSVAGGKNSVPQIGAGTAVPRDLQGKVASSADDVKALPKSRWRLSFSLREPFLQKLIDFISLS